MKTITYFYVYVYFWIIKRTRAYQTRVPYYKELELGKLEYHRREKKNITLEVCIYKELKLGKLEYCVAWNSSLPSSSSKWHFFYKEIHINRSFYEIRVFETQFTQQTQIPGTQVSKSDILLLILQTVVCC